MTGLLKLPKTVVPTHRQCFSCGGKGRFYLTTKEPFRSAIRCNQCNGQGRFTKYLTRGKSLPPLIRCSSALDI